MIGRGSGFPSATVEIEMTNSSDENQRSTDEKTNGSEGKSKTKPIIHPQWRKTKPQIHPQWQKTQPNNFRFRHASNAFKGSEKAWSYSGLLQVLKGETKQVVNQFNPLEKSLLDQLNEENRTNPSKRSVLKFFGIFGICCICNNWRLPGEPHISELTPSPCKTVWIKVEIF